MKSFVDRARRKTPKMLAALEGKRRSNGSISIGFNPTPSPRRMQAFMGIATKKKYISLISVISSNWILSATEILFTNQMLVGVKDVLF